MARRSTTAAQLSDLTQPEEVAGAIEETENPTQLKGGAYGVQTAQTMTQMIAQPMAPPDMSLVPTVKRYMVTNHDGVNVMLNGSMCRLRYGKEVDSQNYDIARLEMMGVVLKEIGA